MGVPVLLVLGLAIASTAVAFRRGPATLRIAAMLFWTWFWTDVLLWAATSAPPPRPNHALREGAPPGGPTLPLDLVRDRTDVPLVAVIGDSFAAGQGAAPSDGLPAHLARALPDADVRNLGQPGASFPSLWWRYALRDRALSPDVVVWVFFPNDLGAACADGGCGDLITDLRAVTPWGDPLLDRLRATWAARELTARTEDAYRDSLRPGSWGMRLLEEGLPPLVREVTDRGGRFVFAIFPVLHRLEDYPFVDGHEAVLKVARDAGAEVVDLGPALYGRDAATLWSHPADHHPNAAGYALAAKPLVDAVLARAIPRASAPRCTPPTLLPSPWQDLETRRCEGPGPDVDLALAQAILDHPPLPYQGLYTRGQLAAHLAAAAWLGLDEDDPQRAVALQVRDRGRGDYERPNHQEAP